MKTGWNEFVFLRYTPIETAIKPINNIQIVEFLPISYAKKNSPGFFF
jgi:hypothetical protein